MLRLVLPKGSLERATLELFDAADLTVRRSSSVDYRATIDDPRIVDVRILRPQEIPIYVAEGLFDVGITGRDWIEETQSKVTSIGEMAYSKNTSNPIRIILAVAADSPWQTPEDLPNGLRVSTEFPALTRRYFAERGIEADVRMSHGATEAKVPEIADAVVDLTETGRAIRAAGLRILDTILISKTEFIANNDSITNPQKAHAIRQIHTLLQGSLAARGRVMLKLNVDEDHVNEVVALVPASKAPTVSKLWGDGGYAIEAVAEKATINELIPALHDAGATEIVEIPLSKFIP